MEHLTAKYPCNVVIFGGNGDLAIRKLFTERAPLIPSLLRGLQEGLDVK